MSTKSYGVTRLTQPRTIAYAQAELRAPDEGEAILDIICSGVCGTDLSIYRGDYSVPLPLTLGHEFVAIVSGTASPSHSPLIGKRVACEINNTCIAYGKSPCEACKRGLSTHCLSRTVTGIINHPGSFAEKLIAPANNLHVLPDAISSEAAVLIEPLAAAIRTFELSPLRSNDMVAVLGCGRLGRLIALVAHKSGARVIAIGRSARHLESVAPFAWQRISFGREPGEEDIRFADSETSLREIVLDLTNGLGADITVEATGVNSNLRLAQSLTRPLGTISLKSTSGVPVESFDATMAIVNELRFQCTRCGPFDKAIKFMIDHNLPDASWITAQFPLRHTAEAIEAAANEAKVIIRCAES